MNGESGHGDAKRRLRGGPTGPLMVLLFLAAAAILVHAMFIRPLSIPAYGENLPFKNAMFGPALEQPIAFSHRVHATDKEIDCLYCHSYAERSLNAGLPTAGKCLGCHNHIIPEHDEIIKLKTYDRTNEEIPWIRVYYLPDHVFFPHYRHLGKGLACAECHGEVEIADRLRQVTFTMGLCTDCHRQKGASLDCAACHQ